MALIVPLRPVPRQTVQIVLADQSCEISVYQQDYGLYVDLSVSNALVIGGVIALNMTRIVRDAYLGFAGDLIFQDVEDDADPVYTGLGTRFLLNYLTEADLAGAG